MLPSNPWSFAFCCLLAATLCCETAVSFACPPVASRPTKPPGIRSRHRAAVALGGTAAGSSSSSSESSSESPPAAPWSEAEECLGVLRDAIDGNPAEAAGVLLSRISGGDREALLDGLLASGPDARLPAWTRLRPLARTSERARMRVLRRTLDRISPPASGPGEDTAERRTERRRRALVSLLRSLSSEDKPAGRRPAIVELEQRAAGASRESATDLVSRRPEGLETPDYEILASGREGKASASGLPRNLEIRRYKPYSVCAVAMGRPRPSDPSRTDAKLGAPELKGASSFGALAGYLFGKNDRSAAMKMTTPVFTTGAPVDGGNGDGDDREMEFVLPSSYWGPQNLSGAPVPLEGSGVVLKEKGAEDRAVLMFGGYASKKEAEKRTAELLRALSKNGCGWSPVGETESLAQYNDPFTVPWRRLNEVSVRVVEEGGR
ncbi:unnamed protein product [Pseudo-nitzschia multistriata]|uniref:SOUL heme-binding protein n=1 Tax=Pseudo-nitzschia multistriata TaxID=183589 RepID=A0A448Z638_9STRA|nr:unnamed protein product [Pseudo-nitzschia multistriata]